MTAITQEFIAYNGHDASCLCVPCCMADMDAHMKKIGVTLPSLNDGVDMSERTRYAAPGQRCGNGVVRKVSAAQVKYIKSLMEQRDTKNLVRLPGSEDIENMSLKGACDLIEKLLACPVRAGQPVERMATEKQIKFAQSLMERKGAETVTDFSTCTAKEISEVINALLNLPDPVKVVAEIEEGMYEVDGKIYRVQRSRESGRLYARLFTEDGFVYAQGAMKELTPEHRMTIEEAQEYGRMWGICIVCCRALTNPESVERGIGPVCYGKV